MNFIKKITNNYNKNSFNIFEYLKDNIDDNNYI